MVEQLIRKKHYGDGGRGVEPLTEYAEQRQKVIKSDYYIYGHLHIAMIKSLKDDAKVLFVNDWSSNPHYVVIDQSGEAQLKQV